MRSDLPTCSFDNCIHEHDGNCLSHYSDCIFTVRRNLLEKCAEEIENIYGEETDLSEEIRSVI